MMLESAWQWALKQPPEAQVGMSVAVPFFVIVGLAFTFSRWLRLVKSGMDSEANAFFIMLICGIALPVLLVCYFPLWPAWLIAEMMNDETDE